MRTARHSRTTHGSMWPSCWPLSASAMYARIPRARAPRCTTAPTAGHRPPRRRARRDGRAVSGSSRMPLPSSVMGRTSIMHAGYRRSGADDRANRGAGFGDVISAPWCKRGRDRPAARAPRGGRRARSAPSAGSRAPGCGTAACAASAATRRSRTSKVRGSSATSSSSSATYCSARAGPTRRSRTAAARCCPLNPVVVSSGALSAAAGGGARRGRCGR